MRNILLAATLIVASFMPGAQSCGSKQNSNNAQTPVNANTGQNPTPAPSPVAPPAELKVLAEGQYGEADEAFVAVVRDPETFAALRELAGELPEVKAELFETHAVVAAFLGYRNTGGYSVSVTARAGGVVHVAEKAPPKGAITTQAITNPFAIVAVPEGEGASVWLEVDDTWKRGVRRYEVREGEFTMSGGIAGQVETFRLGGEVSVTGLKSLETFFLNLKGAGTGRERALRTVATGRIERTSAWLIPRLTTGTLVDPPASGLRATAELLDKNDVLAIAFEPRPTKVADGYSGSGSLRAYAVQGAR